MDYISDGSNGVREPAGPDGLGPELAQFKQPLPLGDLLTPDTALTEFGYKGAALRDTSRQLELGGQFVQRTNNYRHDYPDNGSSYLAEFVNSVYLPNKLTNTTVPCDSGVLCGP